MDIERQSYRPRANNAPTTVETSKSDSNENAEQPNERARHRRKRAVAGRTFYRYSKRELALAKILNADLDHIQRPATRGECADIERPCPFVSCAHHLYLDASRRTGSIKINFPDLEIWEMTDSCSLDLADQGAASSDRVAEVMNLTRQRIRQIEASVFAKLREIAGLSELRECIDEGPVGRRRLTVIQPDEDEDEEDENVDEMDDAVQDDENVDEMDDAVQDDENVDEMDDADRENEEDEAVQAVQEEADEDLDSGFEAVNMPNEIELSASMTEASFAAEGGDRPGLDVTIPVELDPIY